MKNSKRILLSAMVLGVLTTLMTVGTYALWTTSTATAGNVFATGTLSLANDHSSSAVASLSNMVPGDTVTGLLTVTNSGSEDITAYLLTTTASPSSLLDTDTVNGLHVYIQRCSQAWTGTGPTATCGGTRTDVVGTSGAPVPIIMSNQSMGIGSFAPAANDFLKATVSLPSGADNTFQGKTSTIVLTFNGNQRTGQNF